MTWNIHRERDAKTIKWGRTRKATPPDRVPSQRRYRHNHHPLAASSYIEDDGPFPDSSWVEVRTGGPEGNRILVLGRESMPQSETSLIQEGQDTHQRVRGTPILDNAPYHPDLAPTAEMPSGGSPTGKRSAMSCHSEDAEKAQLTSRDRTRSRESESRKS